VQIIYLIVSYRENGRWCLQITTALNTNTENNQISSFVNNFWKKTTYKHAHEFLKLINIISYHIMSCHLRRRPSSVAQGCHSIQLVQYNTKQ